VADSRDGEIARVDPAARRRALWWFISFAALGCACIFVTNDRLSEIEELARRDPEAARQQARAALGLLPVINAAALLPATLYFGVLSARIFRSGRFPPPMIWLIRDTRVVRGPRARRVGVVAAVLSGLFLVLAITPFVFWRAFVSGLLGVG
jgi:hypothetical protein